MASNKNIPQKDQGANQPDKKADAADVDWMIISDISTRIGGSSDIKSGSNKSIASSPSQVSSNQAADNDLEDLEWLRSIGLDEPIERPTSSRNTSNSQGSNTASNSEVGDIDWLIVSDLKTRIDESDNAKSTPSYQDIGQSQTTLQPIPDNFSLDEDLGLGELDFLDNSGFADLDSLGFDTSNSLSIDELQSEIDNTESKIQGLAELLDDNDDSSFDLSNSDNDWDSISGILENNFNQPSSELSLDIASESSEISAQIPDIFGNTEEEFKSLDLVSEQFAEINYSDDLDNLDSLLGSDLDSSEEIQSEEIQIDQIVDDFEIQNALQNPQDQDLSFDEFEAVNLEADVNLTVDTSLDDEFLDDDFAISHPQEPFNPNVAEDEIWSSNSANLESSNLEESVENAFTNDWGEASENAIDDAVWDSPSGIDGDLIASTTSIENAFGISDDWASGSQVELPVTEEYVDFELPNLKSSELENHVSFETTNVDSSIEVVDPSSFAPELAFQAATPFTQNFEQPNNEAEDVNNNENWDIEPNSEDINEIEEEVQLDVAE